MTEEQQRIAIAEACGWKWVRLRQQEGLCDDVRGYPPDVECVGLNEQYVPDFPSDLNAMHEAEKALTADQWYEYDRLMPLRDPQKMHATAAQRAEAFIRSLGLWEETL